MTRKFAALFGALLVLLSIPLSLAAQGLIYGPMLTEHFYAGMVISLAVTTLRVLLVGAGLVLFLVGSARIAHKPTAGRKGLLLPGGILVLLGILISGTYTATTIVSITRHGNLLGGPVLMFMLTTGADMLAWICLVVFIFADACRAAASRVLAIVALAAMVILCAMLAVSFIQTPPWGHESLLTGIGSLVSIAAFGLQVLGVLLYLVMYAAMPGPPSAADATDALSAAPQ